MSMFVIQEQNHATGTVTLHVEYEHFTDAVTAYLTLLETHDIIDPQAQMLAIGRNLRENGRHFNAIGVYGLTITNTGHQPVGRPTGTN